MTEARRANFAAATVILLAGALSSIWVFLVPIFQAPDEPAHFDYAISIYSAHRLIRLSDGTPDWIVSPYTKYLLQASDYERIARHSSMRVPTGYGSKAYFYRVNTGAPSLRQTLPPNGKINYIVPSYPFGFYGLEALWMHAVSLFSGSLVSLFFAARLLCVFLLMVGLYFNYRTAINLGIPRWTGIALIAAVGFFPLTSFVSSYVQPDNLVYALVSAALFFATSLRPGKLDPATFVPLGISLGLLAITKYQFFVSVAVPVALLLCVRFAQAAPTATRRIAALGALVAPTVLLLAVQHWGVDRLHPGIRTNAPSDMNLAYFRSVASLGAVSTIRYVATTGMSGFYNCFVSGGCAVTFWQVVGWFDTPVVIVNVAVETWIRAAISLVSVAVFVVLAYFTSRNALRLLWAAVHRHACAALRIASADPVLNSYFCFLAIMFALYVLTDNGFTAEGRHWYPYVFPAFLCLVWYAPRALRKEHHTASAILAGALLTYALAASGYALADVHQRYYGPRTPGYVATVPPDANDVSPRNAGVLWPVTAAAYHVDSSDLPFSFSRGSRLLVGGLAVLPEANVVPSRVAVVVDSRVALPVLADQYLSHFAELTHNLSDGDGAFYANLETNHLREGAHTVVAYAQRLHDRGYDVIPPVRLFFLTGPHGHFSPATMRALEKVPRVEGTVTIIGACRGASSPILAARELHSGGVVLVGGSVPSGSYQAVWLLADGLPYPTRYDEETRSFAGTVPTGGLALGLHRLTAFAVTERGTRSLRISQMTAFHVLPGRGESEFSAHRPAVCTDPLRQMEGTFGT
ncbi:MAG: DUF2142 domain-containing protein [Candidatus Cybelea sp.]